MKSKHCSIRNHIYVLLFVIPTICTTHDTASGVLRVSVLLGLGRRLLDAHDGDAAW